MNPNNIKIGILGGGQLGRMVIQSVLDYDLNISVLDPNPNCPSAKICNSFTKGDFNSYEDVLNFGKNLDFLTIEIEHVNTKALFQLQEQGVQVYPQPHVIELIKDKGLQKEFYYTNNIPTSSFKTNITKNEILNIDLPFIAKSRLGGYDGKGVLQVNNKNDFNHPILNEPFYIEEKIDFEKELSVLVARNKKGQIKTFEVVEQEFNSEANLVEFLFSPANIKNEIKESCKKLAEEIIAKLDMVGILAVELFLTKEGEILVNEIAPRPHNSGHHTIEACKTSQFQQLIRSILNWELGDTTQNRIGATVNLLGEKNHAGPVFYQGIEDVLNSKDAYLHLYGKTETKPFRKMGHITILSDNLEETKSKALSLKNTMKVLSLNNK